ncbi:MAG TPA: hypothetical protein VJ719_06895 [Chthoniobacterales bacterium]|nr:hypothetical protein [Chthoniobacterales bacterium]
MSRTSGGRTHTCLPAEQMQALETENILPEERVLVAPPLGSGD